MFTEIDDLTEIRNCDTEVILALQATLRLDSTRRIINDVPGAIDVWFLPESNTAPQFWWAQRRWPNGSSHHLFGHGRPGMRDDLTSELEFNVPLEEFSRNLGGSFLRDKDNKIVLAHRGIVGRRTGGRIRKERFFSEMQANSARLVTARSRVGNLRLLLIAPMRSPNLVRDIEVFTNKAVNAKAACT